MSMTTDEQRKIESILDADDARGACLRGIVAKWERLMEDVEECGEEEGERWDGMS